MTGEPGAVPRPPAHVVDRARGIRAGIDRLHLCAQLEDLPGPRNRLHFPEAMAATDELLVERFEDAGWQANRRSFRVKETARRYGRLASHLFPDVGGVNIVATKPGRDPHRLVVVGAHHDTLPETPGADDNGAGLVALMELARILAGEELGASVVLAAFDHEEIGFHGARRFVWDLEAPLEVVGAIIFETMAYTSSEPGSQEIPPGFGLLFPRQVARVRERGAVGDWNAVIHRRSSRTLALRLASVLNALEGPDAAMLLQDPLDLPVLGKVLGYLVPPVRNLARSDHVAFWDAGLPAVQITDTADFRNPHYHQASDTPETVDVERLAAIIATAAVTVSATAGTA